MKKIYFLFLTILLTTASYGQILAENFDYGTVTGDLTTASNGAWVQHSGSASPVVYETTSLSMSGYPSSGIGGSASLLGTSQDVNRSFPDITSGVAYGSALVNLSAVGSGNYFLHFNSSGFTARVGAQDDGNGNVLFGIGTSSSSLTYGTTPYNLNTTYLLVFSYDIASGVSNLHVLSAVTPNEPATPEATNTGNTGVTVNAISFRQSSNIPQVNIDGVRVADNWNEIMNNSTNPSVAIISPASGTTFDPGTTNVDVVFTTANTTDEIVNITVNGTTTQNVTSPFAVTTVDGGMYDVTVDLVNQGGTVDSQMTSFSVSALTVVADIAALRADVEANGTDGVYQLQSVPTVTYTRTSRNQKYIQDASAGILIDDVPGNITTTFAIGDGMSGLTGGVSFFNGVLQFNPNTDATVVASTPVTPEVVTIATLLTNFADYQSELVRINDVTFTETGTFAASTNYTINDASNVMPSSMVFRTSFAEADYIGQPIPVTEGDIVVLVAEFGGAPQVTARDLDDVTLSTDSFEQEANFSIYPNPTSTGIVNIKTTSNGEATVAVFDILGKQVITQTLTNNTLNVSSLKTGVYLVKISQNGATTTKKLVIE
ncbi:T9SS type A sorting domain-containing protein [Lacinutrix sp. MedPE-SW]|uniref:T9SS type A sorting domain-containing protein n=1 Tax=Lacinutrix sp. MedPE-SW TaxID=1860087 RepID=UPI000923D21B|nr:T9SS type A sorting domain-containing protein [Lacinutrix sp. MedPE-SW]OIQ20293.1 MAG: hypothetical protein BM549_10230 [Lacinutrix sp. MedPE-SW]